MNSLALRDFHQSFGARFIEVNGQEVVDHYGNVIGEHAALRGTAGLMDLGFRGRLCLTGADRQRFLNGQVTNNVSELKVGNGCYAALVTAKAKLVSDLNIYILHDEILADFEPGLVEKVVQRLEKFIIADNVQIVDAAPHYGLLSVQGPKSLEVIRRAEPGIEAPDHPFGFETGKSDERGDVYLMNLPRLGTVGYDLFVPVAAMRAVAEKLAAIATDLGGRLCGWQANEIARVEAGLPRFGMDMDGSNLPPEAGLETRAISYNKGCYIGQEVIARIRTYGQVAKALRGLRLSNDLNALPIRGDKLFKGDKEVGYVTSAVESPVLQAKIALGYVRREANQNGIELVLRTATGDGTATIVDLPFRRE